MTDVEKGNYTVSEYANEVVHKDDITQILKQKSAEKKPA